MKKIALPPVIQGSSRIIPSETSSFILSMIQKKVILCFVILQISMLAGQLVSFGQEIELTGQVVNSNQEPVSKVRISLQSMPERYCYSDQSGNFSFAEIDSPTGIQNLKAGNKNICSLENGKLLIDARNATLHISIYDIVGRNMGIIAHEKNLNGKYEISPAAYIQDLPKGIYIAHVRLGSYQKGFKFNSFTQLSSSVGLHFIGSSSLSSGEKKSSNLKYAINTEDTIIFEHDFYRTKHVFSSNLNADIGIVELENFGNYSIPINMEPDKVDLYSRSGSVINLMGKDSSEFTIHFNAYSTFEDKLTIKAIPIDELDGLDSGVELISAVHLEPGGSQFNLPANVIVDLHDIPISDSLVVFLYDDITNKTYYIPYYTQSSYDNNSIIFSLSHFSDIGIGYQPEIPEDSGDPLTSDDFMTEIYHHIDNDEEVPDDLLNIWFEEIVLREMDAVSNIEDLQDAVSEIGLLNTYINFVNKDIADFEFYDELTSSLATKINNVLQGINDACENVSDPCTKLDLARIATTLVDLTIQIDGIDPLNYTDIFNGEVLLMVCDFILKKAMINIDVSDEIQILYTPRNILKKELVSEEIDLEWYSEDPSIASVNQDGIITGIKKGTVKVFAEFCNIRRHVIVNVDKDVDYCKSDTSIYSGTVNIYEYNNNGNVYLGKMIINKTIRITVNLKEGTYTGTSSTFNTFIYNKWNNSRWIYDHTEYEIGSGQIHPSHRPGTLVCNRFDHYDTDAGGITIYPESRIIEWVDYVGRKGVGVLIRQE